MSVGDDVKFILDDNSILTERIYTAFDYALNDIQSKGISVEGISTKGKNLSAIIGGFVISIPFSEIVQSIKNNRANTTSASIFDEKIQNVINQAIKSNLIL